MTNISYKSNFNNKIIKGDIEHKLLSITTLNHKIIEWHKTI